MLRFLADENLNGHIVTGLLRRNPNLDIVRIYDVGLSSADDRTVLEWAARNDRVVITHDVSTMTNFAYQRVDQGEPMPGVLEVSRKVSVATAIEDILLAAECSFDGEWDGQVIYLPLR